ncbi:heat shock transcription factor, X-linked member 4-like [Microplitis demolitor]|uniref:heat shock transcription factor, X-linked member 4-like n=1 Tax=Microplitis demolitor TaxID=69319 RepID=UPI0004CD4027|nr:heat shock transcription factor, X-linked member 4-like [Microplitis demolitor]
MYDYNILLSTRFPQKLWKIINECKTGSIRWSLSGTTILLDYKKFHEEYLSPPQSIFKTSNIASFIRQLNLYGFRKVTSHNRDPSCNSRNPEIHEFLHDNFNRDRADLLSKVCRKTCSKFNKRCDRVNGKNYARNEIINKSRIQGMSRLQMCQLALKQALEQAVEDYQRKKYEESINFIHVNHHDHL